MNGLDAAARIRARDETRALPIVVISAYAGKEEEARCAELGVNVFLRKPITASSLFDAIVEAQGVRVHAARRGLDAPLEREFDGRARAAGRGQRGQPDGGDRASRRGSGSSSTSRATAAKRWRWLRPRPTKYAAILMDMQMPEMDGLARDAGAARRPALRDVPIIAMTANAMKADLDACLAAGMNDHVTKPIDRKALVATLRRWLPAPQADRHRRCHADAAPRDRRRHRRRSPNPRALRLSARSGARGHRRDAARCERLGIERATPRADAVAVCRRAGADARRPARGRRRGRWRRRRPARARDRRRRRQPRRRCAARRCEGARAGGPRGPDGPGRRSSLSSKIAPPSSSRRSRRCARPAAATPTSAARPFDPRGGRRRTRAPDGGPGRLRPVVGERCPGRSRTRPAFRPGRPTISAVCAAASTATNTTRLEGLPRVSWPACTGATPDVDRRGGCGERTVRLPGAHRRRRQGQRRHPGPGAER